MKGDVSIKKCCILTSYIIEIYNKITDGHDILLLLSLTLVIDAFGYQALINFSLIRLELIQ